MNVFRWISGAFFGLALLVTGIVATGVDFAPQHQAHLFTQISFRYIHQVTDGTLPTLGISLNAID
jgi:hypothetical protein